jgi:hypothetical protein
MKPDPDTRCPLCKLPASITITWNGWLRLFCAPCRFSWTDRMTLSPVGAVRQRTNSRNRY